jgi:hypothetical protein
MKTMTKIASILVLILLVSPVLLLQGCGSDVAETQGCPSGSYLANSTDILVIPADSSFSIPSAPGTPAPAGNSYFVLHINVTDKDSVPRNNICVKMYTGGSIGSGSWYTDDTYSTAAVGSGLMNGITVVTDNAGEAFLYWSTPTPAANAATGTTAGKDITGSSWIMFNSGALSKTWTTAWTVLGEPI